MTVMSHGAAPSSPLPTLYAEVLLDEKKLQEVQLILSRGFVLDRTAGRATLREPLAMSYYRLEANLQRPRPEDPAGFLARLIVRVQQESGPFGVVSDEAGCRDVFDNVFGVPPTTAQYVSAAPEIELITPKMDQAAMPQQARPAGPVKPLALKR